MRVSRSVVFLALAGGSAITLAADPEPAPSVAKFVDRAAQDGMTEVALGRLALNKSTTPEVQRYAQRVVADHGLANIGLTQLARSKGLVAPKVLDAAHRAMIESFEGKDGHDFDYSYAQHMNRDHAKAIENFEGASRSGDDEVAAFARKTLPTLKQHKVLAESLSLRLR